MLVASQAAMCTLLLVGAGLFIASVSRIQRSDLGLDVERVIVAELELAGDTLGVTQRTALFESTIDRLRAHPRVEAVAATATAFGTSMAMGLAAQGSDSMPILPGGGPYAFFVTAEYFDATGLNVLAGRPFDAQDSGDAMRVAVVNQTMAEALWAGEAAIGRCLLVGGPTSRTCTEVVGVVENAARNGYRDEPYLGYYLPLTQTMRGEYRRGIRTELYIRTTGPAVEEVDVVAGLLRAFSEDIRWARVEPFSAVLAPQRRAWILGATILSVFGAFALALAALGLFGVLSLEVASRTREIGVRTALGGPKLRILRTVMLSGMSHGSLGTVVGIGVSYALAPRIHELLFEVSPRSPWVFVVAAAAVLVVSAAATLGPALRAASVDPLVALRAE